MNARSLASITSSALLPSSERRFGERKPCRVNGLLYVEGRPPMRVKTLDLSMKGVALLLPSPLSPGTVCEVLFYICLNGLLKEFGAKVQISNTVFLSSDIRAGCRFMSVDERSGRVLQDFMR